MISHGAAKFLKERLCDVSDRYRVHVCTGCGFMAVANLRNNVYRCERCKEKEGGANTNIVQVYIPYACKLIFQELTAMQMSIKLLTDVK